MQTSFPSRRVRILPNSNGPVAARREVRLAGLAEPQVGRAVPLDAGPGGGHCLGRVAGGDDRHVRDRPHHGDVLLGVMRPAQRGVGDAAADADDGHRHVLVAEVVAHLLERPVDREGRDRVGERAAAPQRQPRAEADHALLGHARH